MVTVVTDRIASQPHSDLFHRAPVNIDGAFIRLAGNALNI